MCCDQLGKYGDILVNIFTLFTCGTMTKSKCKQKLYKKRTTQYPYLYQLGRDFKPTGTASQLLRAKHCNGVLTMTTLILQVLHRYQCRLQCNLLQVNINGKLSSPMYTILNSRWKAIVIISFIVFTLLGPSFFSLMHHVMGKSRAKITTTCARLTQLLLSLNGNRYRPDNPRIRFSVVVTWWHHVYDCYFEWYN